MGVSVWAMVGLHNRALSIRRNLGRCAPRDPASRVGPGWSVLSYRLERVRASTSATYSGTAADRAGASAWGGLEQSLGRSARPAGRDPGGSLCASSAADRPPARSRRAGAGSRQGVALDIAQAPSASPERGASRSIRTGRSRSADQAADGPAKPACGSFLLGRSKGGPLAVGPHGHAQQLGHDPLVTAAEGAGCRGGHLEDCRSGPRNARRRWRSRG